MEKKDLVVGKKYLHKSNNEVYYLGEGERGDSVVQPTNGVGGIISLKDSHPKVKDILGNNRFWAYENIHLELKEIEPKSLSLQDLIIGEVYVSEIPNHPEWRSLFKCISNTDEDYTFEYRLYTSDDYKEARLDLSQYGFTERNNYYKASKEESKWLNIYIKANKFIPKENLNLYDDITFELKDLKAKTKDNTSLNDLITRAVKSDNPNLIAEELGCTIQDIIDSKDCEDNNCKKSNFNKLSLVSCSGLNCGECPFKDTVEVVEEWLLSKVNENKFEVGAWYYCESTFKLYFEYVSENSSKVEFYDHIDIDSREFKRYDYLCHLTKKEIKNVRKVDLSEIQEYLPEWHIDKVIEEFTLPGKWCIKQSAGEEVCEWFNKKYDITSFPIGSYKYLVNDECNVYSNGIPQGYIEITLEQFKKYVLKQEEKPIEKWSVGSYVVFLQDEILTRSGRVTKGKIYELTKSGRCPYFKDDNNQPINFKSEVSEEYGLKWFATKSEAEEFAKTLLNKNDMFKKDDYIVIIQSNRPNDSSFPINYCYKQRCDANYLSVYFDAQERENGWGILKFNAHKNSLNWRYANREEAAEYDRLGKPFNITTLNKKEKLEVDSLSEWEDKVKKLNLDVYELADYIDCSETPISIYEKLPGFMSHEKAHLLISKWEKEGYIENNKENYTQKVGDWVVTYDKIKENIVKVNFSENQEEKDSFKVNLVNKNNKNKLVTIKF